ncbi:MAG: gliding motility-associated C-terminal domain-containing protein [Ferruginibacter sp.]
MARRLQILRLILFIFPVLCAPEKPAAQCNTVISAFPFTEDFENSDGGWTVNGFASDWEWGTPSKPVIKTAGSGVKCWVTGGLKGSSYNNGEASWLQSPCFDFTGIQLPYLSFKIFWETESGFDGANLQYSVDGGSSWSTLGSVGGSSCNNNNWYNTGNISFLSAFGSARNGWSGNTRGSSGGCSGGGGSGGWVMADQLLSNLSGSPNVIFRFTFGAGTRCNNFDGIAIDDFSISELPAQGGDINFACRTGNNVAFEFLSNFCPDNYLWDFNDPAAGQANTSTMAKPEHQFSAPGTYNVTVTVHAQGGVPYTTSKTVTVIDLTTQVLSQVNCNGDPTGSATVNVTGSAGPFTYNWNTTPVQNTATAGNMPAGTYTVQVTAPASCIATASVEIINPGFEISAAVQQPGCLFEKGKITLTTSGGGEPFNFLWTPSVSNTAVADDLAPGIYSVNITNSGPCSRQLNFTIANLPKPIAAVAAIADADCNGVKMGAAKITAVGGTPPYTYSWNSIPVQTTDSAVNLKKGVYTAVVTDSNGCTHTIDVTVGATGICNDIYFPSAFTPNAAQNNSFGPLGNIVDIGSYGLNIFNRFGELVFSSNNPLIKWDGKYKGVKAAAGVYVWYTAYTYKTTIKRKKHGTIMLLR